MQQLTYPQSRNPANRMNAVAPKGLNLAPRIQIQTTKLPQSILYVVFITHIMARVAVLLLSPASQSSRLDPSQRIPASPRAVHAEKLAL